MLPWSQYNFPFSGNVIQRIDPDWFFGAINPEVGDSEIEKEIFCKTASYGKQIGMITEVLLSLAEEIKPSTKNLQTLNRLKEIQMKVEKIKTEKKNRIQESAKQLLDKLKHSDPEALKELLKGYEK